MITPDGHYTADPFEEGRGMAKPRTADFMHIGGPYDGEALPVEVDEAGVPVEHYFFYDMTSSNMSRDPSSESQADRLQSLYERADQLGDDGFTYVFEFRGQDVLRNAA